jgi:hypothetical protein
MDKLDRTEGTKSRSCYKSWTGIFEAKKTERIRKKTLKKPQLDERCRRPRESEAKEKEEKAAT